MKGEMVTLTYHNETGKEAGSSRSSRRADPDSVESEEGTQEGPRTAYIDKLYKFKEDDADEEKCDLFFICQDGEVPAHRLVISNASKYIMAMQDDQPPWYPVYISVPDLPKLIVQTLVQLAYTGKMIIPPSSTSDELLDAMQALGWIHTDCLTASYTDSMNPVTDEDIGGAISSKTSESLEAVLKMKFPPVNSKEVVGLSDGEDDGGMEMDLPNVPTSDEDEVASNRLETTPKKKLAPKVLRGRGRRSARNSPKPNATKNISTPSKSVPASPKTTRRKVASPVPEAETEKEKPSKDVSENAAKSESEPRKRGRKAKVEKTANPTTASTSEETKSKSQTVNSEAEPESSQEPEAVRSRTRTIRKPKKFDDLIVLTPTKRKESPVKTTPTKSPTKVVNSTPVEEVGNKKASNSTATKKTTEPAKALPKGRRSASIETNKITSYFSKRSVSKEDIPADPVNNTTEPVQNSEEAVLITTTDTGTSKSRKSTPVDENSDSVEDNGIEIIEDKISDKIDKDTDTSSSTLRRRAKSNASTKSDKEAGPQEASISNHDESETSKTGAGRRKRNFEESEEVEPDPEGDAIPKRRGRKPSTMSNASKSSKASNQEADSTVDGDMDAPEGAPKRKRTRQE